MRQMILYALSLVALSACVDTNIPEPTAEVDDWFKKCVRKVHSCSGDFYRHRDTLQLVNEHSTSIGVTRRKLQSLDDADRRGSVTEVIPITGDAEAYQAAAREYFGR